ncbi:MAG TPA: hypothetical protein VG983_02980 [Caulobacterales bacterium]|jgi:transposase-like protein|nr:hypothetical protein [Caulobacterales bacterium]
MKPTIAQYLAGASATLMREIAPQVDSYGRGHLGAIGAILSFAAREADRAADTLAREQDALRALFADAAEAPFAADLRARLREAAQAPRASLRVSDLERENAALKTLLIELHEAVEARPDGAELEARIWKILNDGADARIVGLGQ